MPVAGPPVFERQNFRISTVIFGCAEYASEISAVFPDKRGLKIVYTRRLGKQPLISGSFCLTGAGQAFRGARLRHCSRRDVSEMLPCLQGQR